MTLAALSPSPSQRKTGLPRPERRTQTLDRQTGALIVPGLGHQFGENLEDTHSDICLHSHPPNFSKIALVLAGPGCPGLQGQQGGLSKG